MANRPRQSPTMPSATNCVPVRMPGICRRPKKTTRTSPPLASVSVASSVATSVHGWIRTEWSRPATLVR